MHFANIFSMLEVSKFGRTFGIMRASVVPAMIEKKYDLNGKKIAILATCGFQEDELAKPKSAIEAAGGTAEIVSLKNGEITAYESGEKGRSFPVDTLVEDVSSCDYDGLVLPGGLENPDTLRANADAVDFVRSFFEHGKPIAAICHGPWLLVEANVLVGRKVTSFPSIKTDLVNAGANWVDKEVVCDRGLITSRKPDDLEAFCNKAIEKFCGGDHKMQKAS